MIMAGVAPITAGVFGAELQRDWARLSSVPALAEIIVAHSGNVGTSFVWEQQLLNTPVPAGQSGGM